MILRRLGNKSKIASKILEYFPEHKCYVEPFFGAGGMFFNKPKAQYNIMNDLDNDVFNLYQVITHHKDKFESEFENTPIHSELLDHWKQNQETDLIRKAIRFLHLSNFTLLGKGNTLKLVPYNNAKEILTQNIDLTYNKLKNVQFTNFDFRKFIKSISFNPDRPMEVQNTFIYCDPPYQGTTNNYSNSFNESDFINLVETLEQTGCKYAISEFNNDFVLDVAKQYNLIINVIGERCNLKNRKTEILLTNYSTNKLQLF